MRKTVKILFNTVVVINLIISNVQLFVIIADAIIERDSETSNGWKGEAAIAASIYWSISIILAYLFYCRNQNDNESKNTL